MSILVALIAVAIALLIGYAAGRARPRRREGSVAMPDRIADLPAAAAPAAPRAVSVPESPPPLSTSPPPVVSESSDGTIAERARIMRSFEAETAMLRRALATREASVAQLADFTADRSRLYGELATSRGETARYRQLVVDLESNAPPPFFGTVAPDDLKLIVGVGPVLERMLHRMGIGSYREIARWSEHDIDAVDARLPEFHGRIRRDAWVTQARALHQSKYGERP